MRDGVVTTGIGAVILAAGVGLTAVTNGQRVFIGAMVVGGIYMLIGLFKMVRGAVSA